MLTSIIIGGLLLIALGAWVGSKFEFSRTYPLVCGLVALAAVTVAMLSGALAVKLAASAVFAFAFSSAGWCLYPFIVDPAGYARLEQAVRAGRLKR